MKRLLPLLLVVIGAGALATGCNVTVTPKAASVNGTTISTSSFNTQLNAYATTDEGKCLLETETGVAASPEGTGGKGTFDMTFADQILGTQVSSILADQLLASKGQAVTSSDLASAQSEYQTELDQAIQNAAQQAQAQEGTTSCVAASGSLMTGQQVLGALPESVRTSLVHNYAVDEALLAHGANITDAQVQAYYQANKDQFTSNCVSVIVTDTQAHATQYLAQLQAGASFADVAKANSLDTTSAPNGGALGCTFSSAQVEQALGVTSLTAGTPIGPIQDPSTGAYEIYMVTSQSVLPVTQVESTIRRNLLSSTDNVSRVSKELDAFARTSAVTVNPQYGTWKLAELVPPTPPPASQLLAAVSGQLQPAPASLNLGNGTGTGSAGSSTSGG